MEPLLSSSSSSRSMYTSSSSTPGGSWVERQLPVSMQPYVQLMRLDKPIGSWLLAWPGLWWVMVYMFYTAWGLCLSVFTSSRSLFVLRLCGSGSQW
jgi:hypothetical protein